MRTAAAGGETGERQPVRAFIAVDLAPAVRAELARVIGEWKRAGADVRWVREENLHLTLVFLGSVEVRRLDAVRPLMDALAAEVAAFELTAAGAGTFGPRSAPRVLWSGFAAPPAGLMTLQQGLTDRLAERGFDVTGKAFQPHVTLGRVRSRRGLAALTAAVASANNRSFGVVPVQRIQLMQSLLSPQGARYVQLHESHLTGVE